MAFLQGPSLKQAEVMKQELGEGPGDIERGVKDLISMCAAAPHLPPPERLDPKFLELFVRGCRMDQERARKKLESFWVTRSRCMDLFECRSLNEPPLNNVCKFLDIAILPKLTDEGYRVTILRIRPNYPENAADISTTLRAILLASDARMHDETLIGGDVFIWEASNMRGSLAAKILASAAVVRRGIHIAQTAYPQRIKRIHVVGAPSFIASSLQLMRSCVNEKIRNRYYIHAKIEDLLEYFPMSILPLEWGGEEESIDGLVKKWRRRIDELREYLRDLNEMCDITTPQIRSDPDLYGVLGSFRKLDID